MSYVFYIGDYGPITATVYEEDGVTPVTPLSATATIVNQHTGVVVVAGAACQVDEGSMTYSIPDGSPITTTSSRYTAYLTAEIDATTKRTVSIPIDVLDKASYFAVDRWRRKVEFSAPDEESLSDEEGRDWIDQAVAYLNRNHFDTGYSSTLGALTPTTATSSADENDIEFFASVAALMARTAWWAGKGNWRDSEMSLDTGPFYREWEALRSGLTSGGISDWLTTDVPPKQYDMYNRDKANRWGIQDEPDDYFDQVWPRDNQAQL